MYSFLYNQSWLLLITKYFDDNTNPQFTDESNTHTSVWTILHDYITTTTVAAIYG